MKSRDVVDTVSKGSYFATIEIDDDPGESPRDWDNLGTMVCFHRRYNLGDQKTGYISGNYSGWDELKADIIRREDPAAILPIRMYEHSGITISVSGGYPYNDPWDSGMIGFIFVSKDKVRAEYSCKRISKKTLQTAIKVLQGEVETYDDYLRGEVYGYRLFKITESDFDPDSDDPEDFGDEQDSCWGYYGLDYVKQEVQSLIDSSIKDDEKTAWEGLQAKEMLLAEG